MENQYPLDFDINRYADAPKEPMPARNKWFLVGGAVLLLLFFNLLGYLQDKRVEKALEEGVLGYYLNDVRFFSLMEGADRNPAELLAADTCLVLNLWTSWCEPCVEEMQAFRAAADKYGDRVRFAFISILDNEKETLESAREFVAANGYEDFNYYYGETSRLVEDLQLDKIPVTYFLCDAEGYAVIKADYGLSAEETGMAIDRAFDIMNGVYEAPAQ